MQVAVTDHAVERYQQRVPSAATLDREAIRTMIRMEVEGAFSDGRVKDHPGYPDRRMIPFGVGKEQMFLALGPNTTKYPGEWAVIGVLFDRETGQKNIGGGATLGDIIPEEVKQRIATEVAEAPKPKTRYIIRIGQTTKGAEYYEAKTEEDLLDLLHRRRPRPEDVEIFERTELAIKQVYVIE